MTIQQLNADMQKAILKQQHWYLQRASRWPNVIPTGSIPERRFNEFYRQPEAEPPGIAMTDTEIFSTQTFFEKYIAPNAWVINDFDYPRYMIQLTEAYGMPIISQQSESIYKQFARRIAQIMYQGTAGIPEAERGVDLGLKGLTNIASPTGKNTSTYNAVRWNAAFGPQNTLRNMAATLETDALDAPFAVVLGNGCQTGLWTTITNTAEWNLKQFNEVATSPGSVQIGTSNAVLIIEDFGAEVNTANTVYPMPAQGTADNVGLLLKPDPAYFQALMAVPPSIDLGPMDTHGRFVPGKAVALVGIIIPQPKAICYHDRIDYA